jgi:hypothetical protein
VIEDSNDVMRNCMALTGVMGVAKAFINSSDMLAFLMKSCTGSSLGSTLGSTLVSMSTVSSRAFFFSALQLPQRPFL